MSYLESNMQIRVQLAAVPMYGQGKPVSWQFLHWRQRVLHQDWRRADQALKAL
jgi:hypothetical protein